MMVFAQKYLLKPWIMLVLGAVLLSVASLPGVPMGNDEGVWAYMGRLWADHGILPYSGAIENKATGIYIVYAISHAVFGFNIWFPRVLAIVAILGTAGCVYRLTQLLFSQRAAFLAMTIFLLIMPLASLDGAYAETESFMNFFRVAAFLCTVIAYRRPHRVRWLIVSGICAGFAVAFKQLAILDGIPLLAFHFFGSEKNWRKALVHFWWVCVGGFMATVASIVPLLIYHGTVWQYIDGAWIILTQSGSSPPSIVSRISGFFRHFFNVRLSFLTWGVVGFWVWRRQLQNLLPYATPLAVWVITDFIAYNADGWYLDHHFKVFAPSWSIVFGIVTAYALTHVSIRTWKDAADREGQERRFATILCIGLLIFFIPFETNYYQNIRKAIKGNVFDTTLEDLGHYLRATTKPGDTVYIWGFHIGQAYYYSDRVAPSRYFSEPFLGRPGALVEIQNDLVNHPPVLIAVPLEKEPVPDWLQEVLTKYQLLETRFGHRIYRLPV